MLSPEMVPVYYRSATLYCSPALFGETFGIVLLEAMASGTPVIASDIDGYREVIPDKEMLFEKGNSKDLAEKVISLLLDESKLQKNRRLGIATAKKYDWSNIAIETENFYRTVLKKGKKFES
jgi:phosphatidylinositol alpha-mannosyltransferase